MYRYGDRRQRMFFPECIDDYVSADAPVRAYDAIIEAMNLNQMGFELDRHKVGCPQYDPKVMLKLLVYGYSYGVRSSRKLERACHYDTSFMWLTGGLKPDFKTIAEFRRKNKKALKCAIKECAHICIKLELIEGNILFIDGSKMRANAGIARSWTKAKAIDALKKIDHRIDLLLAEVEAVDAAEADHGSLVAVKKQLQDKQAFKEKLEDILTELQREHASSVNTTDPDCVRIHSRQGAHAGYNGQLVTDDKHGLIVHSDVVDSNNDLNQFSDQIEAANEVLDEPCKACCADAGYAQVDDLARIDAQGIDVIVPSARQARGAEPGPFDKSKFVYDAGQDCYLCPMGQRLNRHGVDEKKRQINYCAGVVCRSCIQFGQCTTNRRHGRKVTRLFNEAVREKLETLYEQPSSKAIFKRRKERAEHPFGHLKRNLNAGYFLLRGLPGVRAEMALLATCFNITRMITLLGVEGIKAALV